MKKFVVLSLALGLIFASVTTADAKKKAKPIPMTFFFHGTEMIGEIDAMNNISGGTFNKMDTTEPSGAAPKSMGLIDYVVGPNSDCAGNYLYPVWTGQLAGRIVGDFKVTFHSIGAPRSVDVRIWPDIMSQACAGNDLAEGTYPAPALEQSVDLPAGPGVTEVVFKNVNFQAMGSMMVQITPPPGEPLPGRILYDSPDYASSVEFSCIPSKGAKACV